MFSIAKMYQKIIKTKQNLVPFSDNPDSRQCLKFEPKHAEILDTFLDRKKCLKSERLCLNFRQSLICLRKLIAHCDPTIGGTFTVHV